MIATAFSLAALLLGALALRRGNWRHVIVYVGSVTCVAAGLWFAMGSPRPAWFGHRDGIRVVAIVYSEGQWIAVWTQDGTAPPVAFVLPWDERLAAQAQAALRAARQTHGEVRWGAAHAAGSGPSGQARGTRHAGSNGSGAAGASGTPNSFHVLPHHPPTPKEAP